jgi:hypothetical protein
MNRVKRIALIGFSAPTLLLAGCFFLGNETSDSEFEAKKTKEILGISVEDFPKPQGKTEYDVLPKDAPRLVFSTREQETLTCPKPRASYDTRETVQASAPDGSVYLAYCGRDDKDKVVPGHGFRSVPENRRHRFAHQEGYHPHDVYVGKKARDRVNPTLFLGTWVHTTLPRITSPLIPAETAI